MPLYRIITDSGRKVQLSEGVTIIEAATKLGLSSTGLNKTWSGSLAPSGSVASVSIIDSVSSPVVTAIPPSTIDGLSVIKQRLEQQAKDYGLQIGRELTVQQYLDLLQSTGGITQKTVDTLWDKYQQAIEVSKVEPPITELPLTEPPPSPISPGVTIGLTDAEKQQVANALAEGCAKGYCDPVVEHYYTPKIYKATLKGGGSILVEALTEDGAKTKAEAAGYNVAWVQWSPEYREPSPTYREASPVVEEVLAPREEKDNLVKLDNGEWVKKNFYDELPTANKVKLNELGVDKYNQWQLKEVELRVRESGSPYLIRAFESGGLDGFNRAIDEYNQAISDATFYGLYRAYSAVKDDESFKDNWAWFQETYADTLNDKEYMSYLESSAFRDKYASIIQPSDMSEEDYNLIKPYITPEGFDSSAAYRAGENNPNLAVNIIRVANQFTLMTLDDKTRAKIDSGEWTLLPYGQVIDTKALENMPPTYRNFVQYSGLVGFEAYQEKVLEWNKQEHWIKNIGDAIYAQSVGLGQDIKNFALLELTRNYPEVKEGDPKPLPGIGFTTPIDPTTPIAVYTAQEAAELNARRADAQKYYKDLYEAADMAAQEWLASRPQLAPIYPQGFVDAVAANPSALKDPVLWGETIANTLPYTVATGLIVAGGMAGGAGIAITAPLAFAITMSVEGHDIYKDAIRNGASHDQALKLANTYGAISAAIETLGDTIFVGVLGVGAGAFAQGLGKNTANNIVRGAAKQYGWKNLTAGVIKDFVNQGGQEFFQEVVHNAAIKTVNQNQSLLENTANAFVSGVIGTAPFVFIPAGGQAVRGLETRIADVRTKKGAEVSLTLDITPQMQIKILNKVLEPVSGFTVKTTEAELEHLKRFLPEVALEGGPVEYAKTLWDEKGRNIYEAGNNISVGLIDKKTVITGKTQVNETNLAYNEMSAKVNEYANTVLKWKQALKAIADFGLAKSSKQLETLNQYKEQAEELEKQVKELENPMLEAVKNFSDTFLKNSVGLEVEQKNEIKEMPKMVVADIEAITNQLFGERTALEIAKDVRELEGQIKVIEEEMAKGMTIGQLEGYGRLLNILRSQINDLIVEMRQRYLGMGEKVDLKTKKLIMEVVSLQVRLGKAVENLQNFEGTSLDYEVYRKGELATGAEVVKLERDTFEAIQRTTEAIWGRESYTSVLEQLNRTLGDIISSMESLESQKRATKAAFKIYDAIKKQDIKLLKEGVKMLQLEAGKIKDKPLQLAAGDQVKLLEGLTLEKFWARWKQAKVKAAKTKDINWYKSSDLEAEQRGEIRREAERIVQKRLEELLHPIPSWEQRAWHGSGEAMMEQLEKEYDKDYFEQRYAGQFEDIHDFLDVEKEEYRISQEIARQEELQQRRLDLEVSEREKDLAKKLRDKATTPKWQDILDNHIKEREKEVERKKVALKEAEKTKLVIPAARVVTEEERAGMKVAEVEEKELTKRQAELSPQEKAEAEARAKQRIRIAKEAVAKEIEVTPEPKASAFPGIKPRTKPEREWAYADAEQALAQYYTLAGVKTKIFPKTAVEYAVEVGIQAREAVQTQTATQVKTQTAVQVQTQVQAAVKTALKEQTEMATKEQIAIATKLITEIVTRTGTQIKIHVPPVRLVKEGGKSYYEIPEGSMAWAQGKKLHGTELRAQWYYIPPPWNQEKPISLDYPPKGAKFEGETSPQKTIQMIGTPKAKVPKSASIDLGVVDIKIDDYGKKITFTGKGLETNVGQRIDSPTTGLSIPASGIMRVRPPSYRRTAKTKKGNGRKLVQSASVA